MLDSVLYDARYGLRQLRTTPVLVLAVVLSVAIGVGANTAIFSLIDAALLKPLPVRNPDALRIVEWTNDAFPEGVSNINGDFSTLPGKRVQGSSVSANLCRTFARQMNPFEALVGIADPNAVAITLDASPAEQVNLQYVSSNFFDALGALPVIGRPFREDEDRVGHEPVVIVSHRFWMRRLAGSTDALPRNIQINNVPARIVGVAPPGFFGLRPGEWNDLYSPLAMRVAFQADQSDGAQRGEDDRDWWVRQFGRLKPGVSDAAARTQLIAEFRSLGLKPEPIILPGRRGLNALNPRDATALWILMLLVGVLLLIVCANLANLLLSRSVGRQRESAVRLALGAARLRLFRQHLIESGMFALIGGAAGLDLGYVLAHSIHLLFQGGRAASSAFDLHVDVRLMAYTGALSILTALLFGLAPAMQATGADLNDALKAQARSVARGRLRLPRLLVSIQIALCMAALMAAALLGHSLRNLRLMDLGFEPENVAYVSVNPWQAGYSAERVGSYVDHLRETIAGLPEVSRVSAVQVRPLSGNGNLSRVSIPGRLTRIEKGIVNAADVANRNRVDDGFFETLHIPVLSGRTIERRDMRPKAQAAVVDELFARQYFPNQNPLGHRFGFNAKENARYEIVGVVGNSRYNSLRADPRPTVYEPYVPDELKGSPIHFAIRTKMDSAHLAETVRRAVASVDPGVPVTEYHTQTALIDRLLRTERLLAFTSAAFGLIALALVAVGIGGLLAYVVARRTNEIGIRMALGAAASDVIRMVLRDSVWLVGAGMAIGLPCACAIGQVLKTLLFHLEPLDPLTATLSLCTLLAIALIAAWLPARRASKIDPITALREE